jgi:hypothetical protein
MSERSRRRRWIDAILLALVIAAAGWAGWGAWHDRRLPRQLLNVRLGMDRAAVERLLGRPDWEGGCAARLSYLPHADCARELGYSSAFAPIFANYYVIQLDRSGKVVEAEPVRPR